MQIRNSLTIGGLPQLNDQVEEKVRLCLTSVRHAQHDQQKLTGKMPILRESQCQPTIQPIQKVRFP